MPLIMASCTKRQSMNDESTYFIKIVQGHNETKGEGNRAFWLVLLRDSIDFTSYKY